MQEKYNVHFLFDQNDAQGKATLGFVPFCTFGAIESKWQASYVTIFHS